MENDRQVYLLDPQQYSPETIAVAFAKTSRSPESFIQIASELNESKSSEFNEKWVVGYGHSSVAEHAVVHIAIENISRLAVECLQSNRLASYTEKSTRYQTWKSDAFFIPEEFSASSVKEIYKNTCQSLLETYQKMIPLVTEQIRKNNPLGADEKLSAWERKTHSEAVDNCRFLLPAGVLANVGVTINARALEHALVKMLSHPLAEVRQVGQEIKSAAKATLPTLLKYADEDNYLKKSTSNCSINSLPSGRIDPKWCQLVDYQKNIEENILAAYLFRITDLDFNQCVDWVRSASPAELDQLTERLLASDNSHSIPLRELEHSYFLFDVTIDQGAYYEVKRHRMMSITAQELTTDLGYALPRIISAAGLESEYCNAMEKVKAAYTELKKVSPAAAAYVVSNAFNRRLIISSNYRSLVHFIQLRSASNAHFSVRRLAQAMSDDLQKISPKFSKYYPANPLEDVNSIESTFFTETMRA